ncbi:MAG: NAD-dependent epimerase/dehydratase family protein [Bacteroidales bacterium]|nr:NAD-dependent epimerase/dehydratase family protein [Bacteroidales bacterium]
MNGKQTVMVTGGTGLVGSHLMLHMLRKGYRIKALKRPSSNLGRVLQTFALYARDAETLFRDVEWIDADLFDFADLSDMAAGCRCAYHAAAVVSFHAGSRREMLRTNIEGTANMVNVCLEKQIPLCFVSSIGALGRGDCRRPVTENTSWQTSKNRSVYACSKYGSEMEVWRGIAEGLQAVIVNPSVILGAGDWGKGSSSFFPEIHRGMKFYTSGVTAFVDVRDVVRCMVQLMEEKHYGERFILSAGELSYRELFRQIAAGLHVAEPAFQARPWMLRIACCGAWMAARITGKPPVLTKETVQSAFRRNFYSNRKITETLSFTFTPLQQTIADCCRYFLQSL